MSCHSTKTSHNADLVQLGKGLGQMVGNRSRSAVLLRFRFFQIFLLCKEAVYLKTHQPTFSLSCEESRPWYLIQQPCAKFPHTGCTRARLKPSQSWLGVASPMFPCCNMIDSWFSMNKFWTAEQFYRETRPQGH